MATQAEIRIRDLVQISEELAEGALAGETVRAVLIMMNKEGELMLRLAGMRPSDSLGMLQVSSMMVLKSLIG